jgi:3-oxoacyl-[acyl-carrier-protein] synthase II
MRRRVVVTGAGVVTSIGVGREEFWDALAAMRSGAERIEVEGVGAIVAFPAPADGVEERFGRKEARRMDHAGRLGVAAAALALDDAGDLGLQRTRVGAAVGSAHGGAETIHEAYRAFFERGPDRVSPFSIPLGLPNSAASAVARTHRLHGPSFSIGTACAAGSDAIGSALRAIRDGSADAMVAGGADAALTPFVIAGYRKLGALSPGHREPAAVSRPFDRARDGFVMGDGAGFLILEEREHALARGARVLAELAGYGQSCDAGHLTDPDETGAGPARAISIALADAGLAPAQIGYVNAHATSTPAGDIAELRALAAAGLANAPVSSTKSVHGHCLGAAGGVEAVAALMAVVRGVLPAGANLDDPEDDPPVDLVATPRAATCEAVLSNSFGFGGHNAALVFRRDGTPGNRA